MFRNGADTLKGTLFLPATPGRHPAVVMTQDSGPEGRAVNRDLAIAFANNGIAALTYDKRGAGASTGDWMTATFADLSADAAEGAVAIRSRPDIDPARIGVYGHGQGATMLPMIAERDATIAFVIAIGPTGVASDSLTAWHFDPEGHWRSVNGAVFLAWGANDDRVPVEKSRALITDALKRDTPRVELTCVYPGADEALRAGTAASLDFTQDVTHWARVATRLDAAPAAPYSAACK